VYSPHSALDSVLGGVNDWLAGGLSDNGVKGIVEPLRGVLLDPNGEVEGGEGRRVKFQSGIEMSRLEQLIKAHTGVSQRLHFFLAAYHRTDQSLPSASSLWSHRSDSNRGNLRWVRRVNASQYRR
jgi:putative NIF3 family GTP cyclohydrolase 1 type 2